MRHMKSGRKFNRTSAHREAMFRNMASSLFKHELIRTTLPKAKELRRVAEIELVQTRYALRAPRAGTIDALPFELGDRPPLGASTARIAVGAQPYVRVFVPASRRAAVHVGDRFDIRLTGVRETLQGRLREVAKEPAFTPYYALVGDDASKLVFRAEIDAAMPRPAR